MNIQVEGADHLISLCQFIDCTLLRVTCVCVHYNASMCSHYIIHDTYVQAYYMMYLDVHTSRHDHLDVYVHYMMMRHRSRRDENLVQNLVDDT